jgi:hypothetical protein
MWSWPVLVAVVRHDGAEQGDAVHAPGAFDLLCECAVLDRGDRGGHVDDHFRQL